MRNESGSRKITRVLSAVMAFVLCASLSISVMASGDSKKGPCLAAHVTDTAPCEGRGQSQCSGTHAETAVPGRCTGSQESQECKEDGITFVTIYELVCVWNESELTCYGNLTGQSQVVQIANCYLP